MPLGAFFSRDSARDRYKLGMSRTPARCTEADIRRAIRAVTKERAPMAVEIDPSGTIRIVPHEAPTVAPPFTSSAREPVEPKREFRL